MRPNCYLNLLILSIILFSSISPSPADVIMESSNLHNRQKRIIDDENDRPVQINQVPYIVNILCNNISCCGGAILSLIIIITAAHCVFSQELYRVLSGSSLINKGNSHRVVNVKVHNKFKTFKSPYDLALIKIYPAIDIINSPNRPIEMHSGFLVPYTNATYSGWGYNKISKSVWKRPNELRSITVRIISENECKNHYRDYAIITDKFICTYDKRARKGSCNGDSGSPLVFHGVKDI